MMQLTNILWFCFFFFFCRGRGQRPDHLSSAAEAEAAAEWDEALIPNLNKKT